MNLYQSTTTWSVYYCSLSFSLLLLIISPSEVMSMLNIHIYSILFDWINLEHILVYDKQIFRTDHSILHHGIILQHLPENIHIIQTGFHWLMMCICLIFRRSLCDKLKNTSVDRQLLLCMHNLYDNSKIKDFCSLYTKENPSQAGMRKECFWSPCLIVY